MACSPPPSLCSRAFQQSIPAMKQASYYDVRLSSRGARYYLISLICAFFVTSVYLQLNVMRRSTMLVTQNTEQQSQDLAIPSKSRKVFEQKREAITTLSLQAVANFSRPVTQLEILPHVYRRDNNSLFAPRIPSIQDLDTIDQLFFPNNKARAINRSLPHKEFIGFIRITKTASSSVIQFLNQARQLHSFNNFIRFDEWRSTEPKAQVQPQVMACFFGSHPNMRSAPPPKDLRAWNCPHYTYSQLVSHWSKSLRHLIDEEPSGPFTPLHVIFRIFTIVRDPFDRYVSFFHFWRAIYPDWLHLTPAGQVPKLIVGDMEGWMRVRASSNSSALNAGPQYAYLSQDVDRAIRLISGVESLRVLPLVSECFDASLSLLVDRFPRLFVKGSELAYLNSTRKLFNTRHEPKPDLGMMPVQDVDLSSLRQQARNWFAEEYQFYYAAVDQFKTVLLSSNVEASVIQSCLETLDARNRDVR